MLERLSAEAKKLIHNEIESLKGVWMRRVRAWVVLTIQKIPVWNFLSVKNSLPGHRVFYHPKNAFMGSIFLVSKSATEIKQICR